MNDILTKYTKIKRALFDKVYGERLNPEQCRAVFTARGPLLVLAGAGSGKTTVLVNRIAYLVKYGNAYFSDTLPSSVTEETVEMLNSALDFPASDILPILSEFREDTTPPYAILAITFTNKAAREIKERLDKTFSDAAVTDSIWAGTFHSICVRILRRFASRLGYKDGFSIYDTDDKKRMLTDCMKELSIDEKRLSPKAVASYISVSKDKLIGPEDFEITHDPRTKDIKVIYELYEKRMKANNAFDFDDLIMKTVKLLEADSEVREYYQNKFRQVLVDEYQDTNYAQFVLTTLLSDKYKNIMVVGDDDQSIYRFRGATVENILNFDKTYPNATVVKLEQNYRSTETILAAANAVIAHNEVRHDKKLWCDKGEGEKIYLRENADAIEEGRYIIDTINRMVKEGGRKYSDFAILYRINELARSLESSFTKSGVPYRILGGQRFYDRKEIRDMIAYLSLINSGSDNLRLKRIINVPKRKIGDATISAIEEIANTKGVSMFDIVKSASEYSALSKSADRLAAFAALIEELRASSTLPSEIITALFEKSGYREMLKAEGFEGEGRIDAVNELVAAALEYETRIKTSEMEPTLAGFLEEVSLVSDVDKYDEDADAVVMMTIHSAKGLEFPVVFIAGMEDGIFPSEQNMMMESELGEERRLCYVAITRAKERLYITYAKNRTMYGRTSYNMLSCFVRKEIPDRLIFRDIPKNLYRVPERPSARGNYSSYNKSGRHSELNRAPDTAFRTSAKTGGAASFGISKLPDGTRVRHSAFGEGVVVSSRDMGGDILYEIDFASVGRKKLMATFAKLTKI